MANANGPWNRNRASTARGGRSVQQAASRRPLPRIPKGRSYGGCRARRSSSRTARGRVGGSATAGSGKRRLTVAPGPGARGDGGPRPAPLLAGQPRGRGVHLLDAPAGSGGRADRGDGRTGESDDAADHGEGGAGEKERGGHRSAHRPILRRPRAGGLIPAG